MISGVCGGLGEYFRMDPVLFRVIAVILFFWGGIGLIAYIIGIIIIPMEGEGQPVTVQKQDAGAVKENGTAEKMPARSSKDTGALLIGIVFLVIGLSILMKNLPFFDNFYWWFKHQFWKFFWPGLIITVGALLIYKGRRD